MKTKLIWILTKRYSTVLRRLLQEYSSGASVVIDRKRFNSSEFPQLITNWCTNECICSTRDFKLLRGRTDVAGFHDTPDEMWIATTELPFVQKLAAEKLIRYKASQAV